MNITLADLEKRFGKSDLFDDHEHACATCGKTMKGGPPVCHDCGVVDARRRFYSSAIDRAARWIQCDCVNKPTTHSSVERDGMLLWWCKNCGRLLDSDGKSHGIQEKLTR